MANLNARHMRKNPTEAEKKLWSRLRKRQLENHRFRRQQPIGQYIVDFVCFEACLIIELDGGHHQEEDVVAQDARRTNWLNSQGFSVLRFNNNEVFENPDDVLQTIWHHLESK